METTQQASADSQLYTKAVIGITTTANFQKALNDVLAADYNVLVPCFSKDDKASNPTFDISATLANIRTHLIARESIKTKRESQAIVGYKKSAKSDIYAESEKLGSELIQMCAQDVLTSNADGTQTWKQPHVLAALLAGIRLGTEVGTPLTYKYLNCSGLGSAVDPKTGIEGGDFNPTTDYDGAIDNGLTFAEPANGGFRVVIDNTTYSKDGSFLHNRGSIVESMQYVNRRLRATLDLSIGQRDGVDANSLKATAEQELRALFSEGVLVQSAGAPEGYDEESLIIEIDGSTANIQVKVYPVQGLDFVFIDLTVGSLKQTA